jgi:hypothetical protein
MRRLAGIESAVFMQFLSGDLCLPAAELAGFRHKAALQVVCKGMQPGERCGAGWWQFTLWRI